MHSAIARHNSAQSSWAVEQHGIPRGRTLVSDCSHREPDVAREDFGKNNLLKESNGVSSVSQSIGRLTVKQTPTVLTAKTPKPVEKQNIKHRCRLNVLSLGMARVFPLLYRPSINGNPL